jgi:hypothetical protein
MKRKISRKRINIRPMRGPVRVSYPGGYESDELLGFIAEMGYLIYEDPTDENLLVISDRQMKYSDFRKCMDKDSKKWFDETYSDVMDEELDEIRW